MNRQITVAALIACACVMHAGAGSPPAFEAASVKMSDPSVGSGCDTPRNISSSAGTFIMRGVALRCYLEWAYDLRDYEISGPDWINYSNRYDIVAKAAGPVSDNEMKPMLQTLLTERFHLKMHRETKTLDVYALVPGKGPNKLKEATDDEQTGIDPNSTPQHQGFIKQPLSRLLALLNRRMDRPVVDLTDLKGLYNFTIDVSGLPFNSGPPLDPSAPSIFTTVQDDLGLRLQAQKAPVDILAIDYADKVPTEN